MMKTTTGERKKKHKKRSQQQRQHTSPKIDYLICYKTCDGKHRMAKLVSEAYAAELTQERE